MNTAILLGGNKIHEVVKPNLVKKKVCFLCSPKKQNNSKDIRENK